MSTGNVASAAPPAGFGVLAFVESTSPETARAIAPLYRLSVAQYHAMIDAGVFSDDRKVELVEGALVQKMNQNPDHIDTIGLLSDALRALLREGWFIREQGPLLLDDSEPEPDLLVLRGSRLGSRGVLPTPRDVGLLVEVSDTSLRQDQGVKKSLYARYGVAEYWIVNIPDSRVEVYTQPSGAAESPDYIRRRDYQRTDSIPLTLDGVALGSIPLGDVLPAAAAGEE